MSMHFEVITDTAHPLYDTALQLYQDSFPWHEQREAASQAEIMKHEDYRYTLIFNDEQFVGIILYWDLFHIRYVEHFCILPEFRNRHYGQKALTLLQEKTMVLEIDLPTNAISVRRKAFYERCGFVENPYPHIHPPYHKGNAGHELLIMSSPIALTPSEYDMFYDYLQHTVMQNAFV